MEQNSAFFVLRVFATKKKKNKKKNKTKKKTIPTREDCRAIPSFITVKESSSNLISNINLIFAN